MARALQASCAAALYRAFPIECEQPKRPLAFHQFGIHESIEFVGVAAVDPSRRLREPGERSRDIGKFVIQIGDAGVHHLQRIKHEFIHGIGWRDSARCEVPTNLAAHFLTRWHRSSDLAWQRPHTARRQLRLGSFGVKTARNIFSRPLALARRAARCVAFDRTRRRPAKSPIQSK